MAAVTSVQTEGLKGATDRRWMQVVGTGTCPRCGGLLVADPIVDLLGGSSGHSDVAARRCVQCGEVIDPVILQNRRRQPAGGPSP